MVAYFDYQSQLTKFGIFLGACPPAKQCSLLQKYNSGTYLIQMVCLLHFLLTTLYQGGLVYSDKNHFKRTKVQNIVVLLFLIKLCERSLFGKVVNMS